jgi:adenylate cyclase
VGETRKIAAILVSDVVGYSRLTGADEDRILARLRALRSDLIDPTIAVHHGRVVKRHWRRRDCRIPQRGRLCELRHRNPEGDGQRNAEVAPDKRIEFRIGIHLGDVVEESDGDLMGDGVNIAARLQGVVANPEGICISDDASSLRCPLKIQGGNYGYQSNLGFECLQRFSGVQNCDDGCC